MSADFGFSVEAAPGTAYQFSDGSHLAGDTGQRVGVVSFALTTYMSATPFNYASASLVGKVNSAVFDDFPIGTLWLKGLRSEFSRGMFSRSLVKGYELQFRQRPWNQVMRADGAWEVALTVVGGLPKYESADLNILKYM
jgi:hypothetical protein